MKFNSLLVAAAVVATVGQASAFRWEPAGLNPYPSLDVTSLYSLETVGFECQGVEGVAITEVMPVWEDEDGNQIVAVSGEQNPWSWNPNEFRYTFDKADFKANGEYVLIFPEGMLVNGAGEKSDKVQTPYTVDIPELAPGMFDDFEILSIEPDLSQPQAIWNDQILTINTNHNDVIGVTTLQIIDKTTGESVVYSSNFSTARQLGDSSPISWEVANTYKFYEDHTYSAEIIFYNGVNEYDPETGQPTKIVDRANYEFTGRVEGFKYSSVELLSIEPAPMSVVISDPSQAVFTYTFSAPVSVYKAVTPLGMDGQVDYPESCFSSNEDKTVWTLNLSDNDYVKTVDAVLTINIYVRDSEGFQLKGTFGEEYNSCFEADWQCDLGGFPIVVTSPEAGETVDRLSEIVVKAVDGEPMSWTWMGEISVINQLGEVLGTLVYDAPEDVEADNALEEIRFTRWMDDSWNVTDIDLVKEGYYAIQFGPGCFNQGDQFTSKQSKSLRSTFIVSGVLDEQPDEPGIDPAEQEVFAYDTVAPAADAVVTSLSKIQLWYPEMVACEEFTANVYNVADQSLVTTGFGLFDWDDVLLINIDLAEPVVEAGQYEVVIPARVIGTDEFITSGGQSGICNPEIRLLYTVAPDGSAVVSVEAADADAVYYDLAGRRVLNPDKGIYIVNGKKVVK